MLKSTLSEFEARFGNAPLDTHFFASGNGINALRKLAVNPARVGGFAEVDIISLDSLCGMKIWHDPAVSPNEIEIGRVEYRDGQPHKVVTKVVHLA